MNFPHSYYFHKIYQLGPEYKGLLIHGEDAKRFLNGQLTNDLNLLFPKCFQQQARLDRTGRVKSFFFLLCESENRYIALGKTEQIDFLKDDLDKYIIMDEVEIESYDDPFELYFSYKENESGFSGILGDVSVCLRKQTESSELLTRDEFEFFCSLRAGPVLGKNVKQDQLVTDTVLNFNGVNHKKGCYLGQETVSKIESRRGGAFFPVLFKVETFDSEIGEELFLEDKKVGTILEKYDSSFGKFYLLSAARGLRVDEKKFSLKNTQQNTIEGVVHYLPYEGEFDPNLWIESLYSVAVDKFHKEGAAAALEDFKFILNINPTHEDTLETIGVIYGQLGEFEKGLSLMDQVLESNPDSIMAHTNKSLFFMKLGKIEEAEEEKAQATVKSFSMFGKEAEAKRALEEQEAQEKAELEKREGMFKQVLEIDPEDTLANFGLGDISFKRGEYEKALEHLNSVLEADAKYSVGYLLLGKTLVKLEKIDEAKELLEKGVKVASNQGDLMPANEMQSILNRL